LYLKDSDVIREDFEALVVDGWWKVGFKVLQDLKN
jgi:hypothetical protein